MSDQSGKKKGSFDDLALESGKSSGDRDAAAAALHREEQDFHAQVIDLDMNEVGIIGGFGSGLIHVPSLESAISITDMTEMFKSVPDDNCIFN